MALYHNLDFSAPLAMFDPELTALPHHFGGHLAMNAGAAKHASLFGTQLGFQAAMDPFVSTSRQSFASAPSGAQAYFNLAHSAAGDLLRGQPSNLFPSRSHVLPQHQQFAGLFHDSHDSDSASASAMAGVLDLGGCDQDDFSFLSQALSRAVTPTPESLAASPNYSVASSPGPSEKLASPGPSESVPRRGACSPTSMVLSGTAEALEALGSEPAAPAQKVVVTRSSRVVRAPKLDYQPQPQAALSKSRKAKSLKARRHPVSSLKLSSPLSPLPRSDYDEAESPVAPVPKRSRSSASRELARRRETHNVSERLRRNDMKHLLDGLRVLVPSAKDDPKMHTSTILLSAVDYINELLREESKILKRSAKIRSENVQLRASLGLS